MATFTSEPELRAGVGKDLGESRWIEVDQHRIDLFAEATGDHQWIHVDPERAKSGPYGSTIAHGYLTLSLVPVVIGDVFRVENVKMALNYGVDKVRFPAPVPSGSRVRGRGEITKVEDANGGVQVGLRITMESEGGDRPVCVADTLVRLYF